MKLMLFSAPWCYPCIKQKEVLQKQHIPFDAIDVDQQPHLAQQYHIKTLPTLIWLNEQGQETKRKTGLTSLDHL